MKVGVLQFFSWPERRVPLNTVYERALQRIDVMDRTGYDTVWLAEHHFSTYSVCPSVHLMGMHVADRTQHLRIGMAVTLASFYHPLRIAEEVALLDVLSGGRVNWGAGRGFDRTEYDAFEVTEEESYPRFREHVDIVRQAWTSERLTYHGTYWDFDDVEVLPSPFSNPIRPCGSRHGSSPDAVEWCARQGYTILMDPHSSHAEIGRKRRLYEDAPDAGGPLHGGPGHPAWPGCWRWRPPTRRPRTSPGEASWTAGPTRRPRQAVDRAATATEAVRPGHQAGRAGGGCAGDRATYPLAGPHACRRWPTSWPRSGEGLDRGYADVRPLRACSVSPFTRCRS